jgi:hypothetical protein
MWSSDLETQRGGTQKRKKNNPFPGSGWKFLIQKVWLWGWGHGSSTKP